MKSRARAANFGQSLVELIIGIAIVSVIAGSVVGALVLSVRINKQSVHTGTASALAQELLDKTRSLSEGDWSKIYELSAKGASSTYFIVPADDGLDIVAGGEGVKGDLISQGLVAHWRLDESTGTVAYDSSGNSRTGVFVNDPAYQLDCSVGGCLSFDSAVGSRDYVDAGTSTLDLTNQITVSAWVYHSGSTLNDRIVSKHGGSGFGWMLAKIGGPSIEWRISTNGSDWNGGVTEAGTFPSNIWLHIAATYDGTNMRVYKDGVELSGNFPVSLTGNINNSPGSLQIARDGYSGEVQPTDASIDDVRIYNRALSDDEIKRIHEAPVYSRWISIENVNRDSDGNMVSAGGTEDPSTQKVVAYVEWQEGADTASISMTEYITRWARNKSAVFTDWSGSSTVEGPIITPDSNFSTSSGDVSTSTQGSIILN